MIPAFKEAEVNGDKSSRGVKATWENFPEDVSFKWDLKHNKDTNWRLHGKSTLLKRHGSRPEAVSCQEHREGSLASMHEAGLVNRPALFGSVLQNHQGGRNAGMWTGVRGPYRPGRKPLSHCATKSQSKSPRQSSKSTHPSRLPNTHPVRRPKDQALGTVNKLLSTQSGKDSFQTTM